MYIYVYMYTYIYIPLRPTLLPQYTCTHILAHIHIYIPIQIYNKLVKRCISVITVSTCMSPERHVISLASRSVGSGVDSQDIWLMTAGNSF